MDSPIIITVLVVYLVVLLIIGAWARRDTKSIAGYYVADKKLPSWVIAFSSNASGESAWLLLGLTGMGYWFGVHALWIVLGEVLGVTLGWVLVALPFKEYTDRYDSITVPDFLESRFRDSRHVMRILGAVVIFTMVLAYTGAQLTASGKAFDSFLGTGYTPGVLIGIAIILYYTTIGGYKAVAYSDLLQGVLMFLGLLLLPIVGIVATGGWDAMMAKLDAADPSLLQPMGPSGFSVAGVISAVSFIGIGLAFLGAPQLLTRFISAGGRKEIVGGSVIAVICVIVFDLGAVFAGMAGRTLFPGLDAESRETILPLMSAELFPTILTGVFLVIVLAAIMSTVDSLLLLASSAVVRDLVQKGLGSTAPEQRLSLYGKLTTVVLGVGAMSLALQGDRAIFDYVIFAWAGLGSAFAPVVLCALFWKRTTKAGAIAGMLAGFLTTMLWVLLFQEEFYDLSEMLPGFGAGFLFTIGVSLCTKAPEGAAAEFDAVWQSVGHPFRRAGREKKEP